MSRDKCKRVDVFIWIARTNAERMEERSLIEEGKEESLVIGSKRRYYTPNEVALHNCKGDCWISIYCKVYDLTGLLKGYNEDDPLIQPMLEFAGKDISEWFDQETTDVKRDLHPDLNLVLPVLPYGRFIHVAARVPGFELEHRLWRTVVARRREVLHWQSVGEN